jgi:hypothetical protein
VIAPSASTWSRSRARSWCRATGNLVKGRWPTDENPEYDYRGGRLLRRQLLGQRMRAAAERALKLVGRSRRRAPMVPTRPQTSLRLSSWMAAWRRAPHLLWRARTRRASRHFMPVIMVVARAAGSRSSDQAPTGGGHRVRLAAPAGDSARWSARRARVLSRWPATRIGWWVHGKDRWPHHPTARLGPAIVRTCRRSALIAEILASAAGVHREADRSSPMRSRSVRSSSPIRPAGPSLRRGVASRCT